MIVEIHRERPEDIMAIDVLIGEAFRNVSHSAQNEGAIMHALRNAGALTVSLVATVEHRIIGYIAISPVSVSDDTPDWYGLGPVCVHPDQQGSGVGSRLIRFALAEIQGGSSGCVVLGEPEYYGRFGFRANPELKLPDVPEEYFQVLGFQGDLPRGWVKYHDAFSAV